jgi:hypothetical protein
MKLMAHPKTLIAIAVGRFLGATAPSYDIDETLLQLGGDAQALATQSDDLMSRMVRGMRAVDPQEIYEVGRPRRS